MTSGAVRQVIYGRLSQTARSFGGWYAHVLDIGVVWGCSSGDGGWTTGSSRLALLDLCPLSHPHGHVFSNLWFAVPGHHGMLAGANLWSG